MSPPVKASRASRAPFCSFRIRCPCSELSPTFSDHLGSFVIRLLLYMDDGTIVALTEAQRHKLVLKVLQWADMWNTTISIQKSVYASFINSSEERQLEARLFKEEEQIKTVGLTIFKDGLNPHPALKAIIARAALRAKALLAPQGGFPLRFDVISFLYDKFALSILAHSRPFVQAETFNCRSLQSAQDSFA